MLDQDGTLAAAGSFLPPSIFSRGGKESDMTFRSSRLAATGLAATLLIGSALPANARDNWGPAAAGLVGGLVIGGAIANSRPAYAYPPPVYYAPPPVYSAPPP